MPKNNTNYIDRGAVKLMGLPIALPQLHLCTSCGARRVVDLGVYIRLLSGSWPTDEASQDEKAVQFLTIVFLWQKS